MASSFALGAVWRSTCGKGRQSGPSFRFPVGRRLLVRPGVLARNVHSYHMRSKFLPVKRHRGEPGHTRDTRAHTGTRITQTTSQPSKPTNPRPSVAAGSREATGTALGPLPRPLPRRPLPPRPLLRPLPPLPLPPDESRRGFRAQPLSDWPHQRGTSAPFFFD